MGNTLDILVMVGQLILALSILVGVHEAGHLVAAKVFGMRVEQFSIGFPPKIFGFRYKDTVYSIGAIPLGGFVKISGMIDESLDLNTMKEDPKPWEFRAKPAWQRLIVMLGGIIVNVITGIVIFIGLTYYLGETDYSMSEVNKYGIVPGEFGKEIGFEIGDKIVAINGQTIERYREITDPNALLESNSYYTILRDGNRIDIPIPSDFIEHFSRDKDSEDFISPIRPFVVGEIAKDMGAAKAGLKPMDKIVKANGKPIQFYHEFKEELMAHAGETISLEIERPTSKEMIEFTNIQLDVEVNEEGKIGFVIVSTLAWTKIDYGFGESIVVGTKRAFSVVWVNIKAFGKMFRGELSPTKNLRGPLGIMEAFGPTWDWLKFWTLTGLISMVLAFMNLLPIPALDGGHVVFLTYEIVSGRKPSDKFLENAQKVGMVLLLGLMVFVFYNDIMHLFSK